VDDQMIAKASIQVARRKRYVANVVGQNSKESVVVVNSVKYNLLCASISKAVML
jgi:hypothetical protein